MPDIRVLGGFWISHDDTGAIGTLSPLLARMFVYLMLNNRLAVRREKMVAMFGQPTSPCSDMNAFSTAIWRLKTWISANFPAPQITLYTNRSEVFLSAATLDFLDAHRFESSLKDAYIDQRSSNQDKINKLNDGLQHYHGPFMDGFDDDWILIERERLHCLYVSGLERLMVLYSDDGNYEAALSAGRKALCAEPYREYIYKSMIDLYRRTGQRLRAYNEFKKYCEVMKNEIGADPLPEIVAMMDDHVHDSSNRSDAGAYESFRR